MLFYPPLLRLLKGEASVTLLVSVERPNVGELHPVD